MQPKHAIIFDRDGTLIEHVPYVSNPDDVRLLPGVRDALRDLHDRGYLLFLHTNQSGIGRGMFTLREAQKCNERMMELIDLPSPLFQEICIAPEHPREPSKYRKPSPAFAREIIVRHALAPKNVYYVGDRVTDLETANAAGTRGIGIATGLIDLRSELRDSGLEDRFPVFNTLGEGVQYILSEVCQ